ncbi:PAS domain S-box protein [Candidatus Bathycorpusculum sp.]|uniref:PAS domain S-box protein n=1 Tax=Candidatus Bathycorpusculum sp. TaxID=2994959 RepID=UPI002822C7A9|nr:PAS domain S-box protein [Candidatus Termitimicrobium sp.]MCL2686605.1 PAS domain S-box protein [Candidatus Termitimicrobium sp.]
MRQTILTPKQQKANPDKHPTEKEQTTQHKNTEQENTETNQKLQLILESIQDGLIILDHNWQLKYVNKCAAKGFCAEAEKLVGKNLWKLFPKYSGTLFEKTLHQAKENKQTTHFEWDKLYNTPNTWEISVFPASNDLVIIWRDISKRKKLEKTLQLNMERFSKAFNCCQAALFISQLKDGLFLDANEAFLLTFGFSREEVIGNTAFTLNIYPDLSKRKEFAHILQTQGAIRNLEVYMQTKTGRPLTLIASVDHIMLNGQDFTLGTFTDITERKKDEEIHRENEERLKQAQHLAHMGNWTMHVAENRVFWSEELFDMFKLKPDKYGLEYEIYKTYIHPEDFERVTKITDNFIAKGKHEETTVFDYRVVLSDGSVRDLHTERTIVDVDSKGKPTKIMGIEQDISERRKIEQQLERHHKQLEQLVEERTKQLADSQRLATIGQTAGMVGHDIRNPLQSIMSSLYLIKEELDLMTDSKEKNNALQELIVIGEQINYIDKIIADLQDYARPIQPEYTEVDIPELIDSIFQTVNIPIRIMLRVNINKIPQMQTDPTLMRRVLTNLINNAIQAMTEGGTLTINIHQDKKTNKVIIEIEDTGKGIPKEVQEKLFTPLFTTKSKGQGFGLAVVKRITDALEGEINFTSQETKGTKFTLKFHQNHNRPLKS